MMNNYLLSIRRYWSYIVFFSRVFRNRHLHITVSGRPKHLHVVLQTAHRVLEIVQLEREIQQRQVAGLHQPDAAQRRQHGNGNAGGARCGLCGRKSAAATPAQSTVVRRAKCRCRTSAGPPAVDHRCRP